MNELEKHAYMSEECKVSISKNKCNEKYRYELWPLVSLESEIYFGTLDFLCMQPILSPVIKEKYSRERLFYLSKTEDTLDVYFRNKKSKYCTRT